MEVKKFDTSCAACHSSQIQGEGMSVKGVAFFTVPGIDLDTLTEKGISLGDWPKLADGKITPFMELLLNRQPGTRDAMQKLRGVDPLDLRKATPEQIAASDEMITQVEVALMGAEPRDREAFILFAIEGFTLEEIATISDRKLEEVRQSIARARERLKKGVAPENEFRDELLQHSRTA